jgi:hypothetical protein
MSRPWLALLLLPSLALAACTQPRKDCTTGAGPAPFAAKYTLKADSKVGTGDCDTLKGEAIGLEKYNPARADNPEKEDFSRAKLAIQSATLGVLAAAAEAAHVPDKAHQPFSLGDFASATPDDNNVCRVSTLSPAEQSIPEIPPDPATSVKYEWSRVRIFVTASAPGTQMAADLRFTKDGCSASYSVLGVWPAVDCGVYDDTGMPTGTDPTLCAPPDSGINPDFKANIDCDKDLMLCVLKAAPKELE